MKIVPLTFACPRDSALLCMLVRSFQALQDERLGPHVVTMCSQDHPGDGALPADDLQFLRSTGARIVERPKGWGNGCAWNGGILKIAAIRMMLNSGWVNDDDYILSVDSDVLFTDNKIFDDLENAGLAGPVQLHNPPITTRFGQWSHVSGCCAFIRGDIARKVIELPETLYSAINEEFRRDNLATNEDILVSYMANYCGAVTRPLNHHMCHDLEAELIRREKNGSFFHFNVGATTFLGVQITGKWDIPKTLAQLNLGW